MAVPPKFRKPLREHAHLVKKEAKRLGVSPEALLAKVAKGESGWSGKSVSSAGAREEFQFIPSTRAAYKKKYGVDAWGSPSDKVKAAALHIKNTGLAGYNPGMSTYTKYILGQKVGNVRKQIGGGSSGGSPTGKTTRTIPGLDNSDARKSLLMDYLSRRNDPSALLTLGAGLKDAQDTPDRTVTTRTRGKAKGPTSDGRLRDPRKGGLVQFGRQLQKQGASVREHPAFDKVDPVHVQGSEHYKRRAIDVPVSDKAQGDKIAQRARKRGFDVLWQVSGHYGHVHISKPGGLK